MNKLIKKDFPANPNAPPNSLMSIASVSSSVIRRTLPSSSLQDSHRPVTSTEQYWAARALTAETLLTSRALHQRELRGQAYANDVKRSKEIAEMARIHEAKQATLEKLVVILLSCLLGFGALVIYLLHRSHERATTVSSNWPTMPVRFTVPILSPFASVVEHESSVIGTKSIAVFILTMACLCYTVFRHWIRRPHGESG